VTDVNTVIDLISLFREELELCRLKPGEIVAIYTEGGGRPEYAAAFAEAADSLGATVYHVDLPGRGKDMSELGGRAGNRGLSANPALVEALKRSDLVIDLVMLLFEPEKEAIQEAGTRILSCIEPPDTVRRLFPTAELRRRARLGEELLKRASELRVKSDAGTDLAYELGQYTPFCQYGIADEPGRWDHFASTMVVTVANDAGVNGEVVFDRGDVISPFVHYVQEPVHVTVRDGVVTTIEGGYEARYIEDYMSRYDDRARAVSHIGWGLNANARWDAFHLNPNQVGMDPRSYEGCVMFSTGPNTEFGGTNDTPCHFDMPLRNCSLWVDGEAIVEGGRLVEGSSAVREVAPV